MTTTAPPPTPPTPRANHRADPTARAVVLPLCVILAVVLAGLVIRATPAVTAADLGVIRALESVRTPFFDAVALADGVLFSPTAAVLIVGIVAAVLLLRRRPGDAVAFVALVALPWLGSSVVKDIVQRPRPLASALPHHVITDTGFGFPSGHTSFAVALGLALLLTFGASASASRMRIPLLVFAVAAPLLTAPSRVYLGVHSPTDVVAALVYATAAVLLVDALIRLVRLRWAARAVA